MIHEVANDPQVTRTSTHLLLWFCYTAAVFVCMCFVLCVARVLAERAFSVSRCFVFRLA